MSINHNEELLRRTKSAQSMNAGYVHKETKMAFDQVLEQMQQQNQVQEQMTAYDQFCQHLKPLPAVPNAPGADADQENLASKKQRKKARKRYKKKGKEYQLLTLESVKESGVFATEKSREEWANEKMSHTDMTREQIMKQILNDNDYSQFENLDLTMRNLLATKELHTIEMEYRLKGVPVEEAVKRIKASGKGVSGLLNPVLRLGLSLGVHNAGQDIEKMAYYQKLDEALSTEVMTETLIHVPEKQKVKEYFESKKSKNADRAADNAIEENKAQQIQIAKRLLLMQLSNFRVIEDNGREREWTHPMAVALSHCSRVVLTLPKQKEGAAASQKRMWDVILKTNGTNAAQDNSRASSTHSLKRRKVASTDPVGSKEKKVLFNFSGQRGMNCAIGGLGNAGISGKTLCNDGSCGHFYSMYLEGDSEHYGAMLMGLESDANGVMNQMGHTHDIKATAEKASSLGGQRVDEIGMKYGGRQCDLSQMSAENITAWMEALERAMLRWQNDPAADVEAYHQAMRMLSGATMTDAEMKQFATLLQVPNTDQLITRSGRSCGEI